MPPCNCGGQDCQVAEIGAQRETLLLNTPAMDPEWRDIDCLVCTYTGCENTFPKSRACPSVFTPWVPREGKRVISHPGSRVKASE